MMSRPPALLLGIPVDDLTMDEAVDVIGHLVDRGRTTSNHHQIATVNLDFLTNALDHELVRRRLQEATVCLPDGTPPLWAAAALGMPLRERVAGSDLVPRLFEAAAERSWNIHCLGSSVDVASGVERLVAEQHPTAAITVDPGPLIGPEGEAPEDLIDEIRAREPDILLVALGHPKQEHFIATHGERLGVPVMVGIGGTLDLLVGKRVRAPRWVRSIGLEWAYRAAQEPRRLVPRYARDLYVAVPAICQQWVGSRRPGDGRWQVIASDRGVCLSWNRTSTGHPDATGYGDAVAAIRAGAPLTIDIASGIPGDADIAQLVGLWRVCRLYDREIVWEPAPDVRLGERLMALALPSLESD